MDYYEDLPFYSRWFHSSKDIFLESSLTERTIFVFLFVVALLSGLGLLTNSANKLLITVPTYGGSIIEGVVGTPRFVNPVLATSDADKDLDALIFSGLTRQGKSGIEPDLATYTVSEDGREYKFTLNEDAYFHDGKNVTADDVIFTIEKTQDPELRSPRRGSWAGVDVEKINERELVFRLKEAYPGFLSATTMGILPKSHFEKLSSQDFLYAPENIEPIGAGPFRVKKVIREDGATIGYDLSPWKNSSSNHPFISSFSLRFYPDENSLSVALRSGEVQSAYGLSPSTANSLAEEGFRVERQPLPRLYAVFLNQSHAPVLADHDVRNALNLAVDKEKIVKEVLVGYGSAINGPIPPALPISALTLSADGESKTKMIGNLDSAKNILEQDGFSKDENGILVRKTKKGIEKLSLSISTADSPELVKAANLVADSWKSLGVEVEVKVFPVADLTDSVIRKREYDAILFGEVVGRSADFYGFWHSSQRTDPGLNIAGYTNSKVDNLLAKARVESDDQKRDEALVSFATEVEKDTPAIFLYAPEATYVLPKEMSAPLPELIAMPSERFALIFNWYTETQRVWSYFSG